MGTQFLDLDRTPKNVKSELGLTGGTTYGFWANPPYGDVRLAITADETPPTELGKGIYLSCSKSEGVIESIPVPSSGTVWAWAENHDLVRGAILAVDKDVHGPGAGAGGRGGGVYFPEPPLVFAGASLAAARTARDTHFAAAGNADDLARYQGDQFLGIILKPNAGDQVVETYLPGESGNAYDNTKWIDRGSSSVTDAHIDSRIASPARANNPAGTFGDARIPPGIARDTEVVDLAGALLATLDLFQYNAATNALSLAPGNQFPQRWSTIPVNTPIVRGKVVEHGGAYFGCITAHNRGGTGPDGDAANWTLLSNFRGAWAAAFYPAGSFVTHAGLPWMATEGVVNTDPPPNAVANTKWLLLGSAPRSVVTGAINQNIPSTANGNTYALTGSTARTFFLPNASGAGEVADGWEVVLANRSSAALTITPNGADRINGTGSLAVPAGEAVKLQKYTTGRWAVIADSGKGSGGSDFAPTKANLYEAVKAIFLHNTAVSADDANNELDFAVGAAGALADNSIAPIKALAEGDSADVTAARQKAWRQRLGSSSIGLVANALPAVAAHNTGDTLIIGRGGATVVPFREVDEPATELTDTVAGDVMMLLAAGWTRIGNLFSGGIAAAAAQASANALRDRLVVSLTQGNFYGGNADDIQETYHINVQSMPGAFSTANIVQIWIGDPGISRVVSQTWDPEQTQRVVEFEIDATVANNLASNNLLTIGDELGIELRLIAPGSVELYREAFDFPLIAKPATVGTVDQTARDAAAAARAVADAATTPAEAATIANARAAAVAGPVLIISNIASYDATQNRFEDSSGNEVVVPNGSIVTLTQAVYDAAVADADFTPNANSIFLTR